MHQPPVLDDRTNRAAQTQLCARHPFQALTEWIGLFRFKTEIRVENGLTASKRLEVERAIQLEFRQDRDATWEGRAEITAIDLDAQDLILDIAARL